MQYFLRKTRAIEELALIEVEMKNCIEYWHLQKAALDSAYLSQEGGVKYLLRQKLEHVCQHSKDLHELFSLEQADDDYEDNEFSYETDYSYCSSEEDDASNDQDISFYA